MLWPSPSLEGQAHDVPPAHPLQKPLGATLTLTKITRPLLHLNRYYYSDPHIHVPNCRVTKVPSYY